MFHPSWEARNKADTKGGMTDEGDDHQKLLQQVLEVHPETMKDNTKKWGSGENEGEDKAEDAFQVKSCG